MTVVAYNSETDVALVAGDITPTKMHVDVTMPIAEQEKFPVFQDIMIMMTARWTSASYSNLQLDRDIVFQNLLYTIKFEPIANVLFADLVASQTDVIKAETLILDASNSYISNMPVI